MVMVVLWNVLSSALGIIGILLAFYFYCASRRIRDLVYICNSVMVIDKQLPAEVAVSFKGEQVTSLFVSTITLWNQGREPIRREDMSPKDPLIVGFQGRILSLQSIESSRSAVASHVVALDENRVLVEFDFLDEEDGISFTVLTDCNGTEEISFKGTIVGMPRGITFAGRSQRMESLEKTVYENRSMRKSLSDTIYYLTIITASLPFLILSVIFDSSIDATYSLLLVIALGTLFVISLRYILRQVRRYKSFFKQNNAIVTHKEK